MAVKDLLEIPISHVSGTEVNPNSARQRRDLKLWRTYVPGTIAVGTFIEQADGNACLGHAHPEKASLVRPRAERYTRLVLEVESSPRLWT